MDMVAYFDNMNQKTDRCTGQIYFDFLDYAFTQADYFMLVYVNYYGHGYSKVAKTIKNKLEKFKVKSRTNPSWPGTPKTYAQNTTYKVVFYRTEPEAKMILKGVNCLSDWAAPSHPQDLAFFKGNRCWFYSVGHEKIGAIISASEADLNFLEDKHLALRANAKPRSQYFDAYDEDIEGQKTGDGSVS